ncbi:MAG: hypothetical protein ABSD46_00975 [Bacteroidota bacterium]
MKQNNHRTSFTSFNTIGRNIRPTVLLSTLGILPLTLILSLLLVLSLIIVG